MSVPEDRKLLFVARTAPFPLLNGAAVRTHRLLTGLAESFDVTFITLEHEPGSPHAHVTVAEAQRLLPGIRVIATPGLGSRKRAAQLRTLASRRSWECGRYALPELRALVAAQVERLRPAVVHFDDIGTGLVGPFESVFSALAPHNVEHRIVRDVATASTGARRVFGLLDSRKVRREELSLWKRMRLCVAVSELDANTMRAGGARHVEVCPNGTDRVSKLPPPRRSPSEPFRVLFVGTGTYQPNARGLRWFVENVHPIVRESVPTVLEVVGPLPRSRVEARGVEYVGPVPELAPYYARAHAAIVPVFEGSGTRLKVVEAAAWGRPMVSTALGAEGLPLRPGEHFVRGETAEEFAGGLTSIARWCESGAPALDHLLRRARSAVEHLFWPDIAARLADTYRQGVERLMWSGDAPAVSTWRR
jgi:glycosyltransferase involved in cell wall biosynthesis